MTHNDVNDEIWYQIQSYGAVIILHAKFGPNQRNFGKTDSRNPAMIFHQRRNFKILISRNTRNKIRRPTIYGFMGIRNTWTPETDGELKKVTTYGVQDGRGLEH